MQNATRRAFRFGLIWSDPHLGRVTVQVAGVFSSPPTPRDLGSLLAPSARSTFVLPVKNEEWLKALLLRLHPSLLDWRVLSAKARVNMA